LTYEDLEFAETQCLTVVGFFAGMNNIPAFLISDLELIIGFVANEQVFVDFGHFLLTKAH